MWSTTAAKTTTALNEVVSMVSTSGLDDAVLYEIVNFIQPDTLAMAEIYIHVVLDIYC